MKAFITAALLSVTLLAAPIAQAASYQDRAMATGAVVGATTGAVVGSAQNQAFEGALFGAVLGTIAGAVIGNQQQPVHVVHQPAPRHYKPVRHVERRHVYARSSHNSRHEYVNERSSAYAEHDNRQPKHYVASRSDGHGRYDRHR